MFGLVLGLALAEVLSGFGTALQSRRKVRVGWLTPLLGLFVALDLTSIWTLAWSVREQISADYFSMMAGLLITSLYYLVARLVFPNDQRDWPDFDAYYFAHKRWVLGGILLCNCLAFAGQVATGYNHVEVPLYLWVRSSLPSSCSPRSLCVHTQPISRNSLSWQWPTRLWR